LVASGDIATPLRELVGKQPNVQILLGEVTQLIPAEHQIVFNGKAFSYDHLLLATGSGSSFFGKDNSCTFAPPKKSSSTPKKSADASSWRWSKRNKLPTQKHGNFFKPLL
jgi:NADH dehydrogenase FAD-containing subunit